MYIRFRIFFIFLFFNLVIWIYIPYIASPLIVVVVHFLFSIAQPINCQVFQVISYVMMLVIVPKIIFIPVIVVINLVKIFAEIIYCVHNTKRFFTCR